MLRPAPHIRYHIAAILAAHWIQFVVQYKRWIRPVVFENVRKVIQGIQVLGIPILWTEQYPEGLGPTIPEVADLLPGMEPISKVSFSCCRSDRFVQALKASGRHQAEAQGFRDRHQPRRLGEAEKTQRKAMSRHTEPLRRFRASHHHVSVEVAR